MPTLESIPLATLKHYVYIFDNERVYRALGNSLFLAVGGATVAMVLAALTAYITVRTKVWGRGLLEALTFLPWGSRAPRSRSACCGATCSCRCRSTPRSGSC